MSLQRITRKKISRELIYEFIKDIQDPEKDCTLEELDIVEEDSVTITEEKFYDLIVIEWKPTVPNCSLALNIGLCMRKKIEEEIKAYMNCSYKYKLDLYVKKGTHLQEDDINRQINDKERYSAAYENPDIIKYINRLII